MRDLQHNIVNVLYTVKGIIESHLAFVEEGRFRQKEKTLEHAHETLRKTYERVNKALDIIRRLGVLLKVEEETDTSSRRASLNSAWQETLRILRREFPLNEIEIIERIPENFPLIQCSKQDLREIFYHLCENALQAMSAKSNPATMKVSACQLSGRGKLAIRAQVAFSIKEEPYALITLSDTGPGVPTSLLSCLFQPFFTTKPESEGNGLGLYLTKALVTKNHGRITASSFQDFGTTFGLEFSLAQGNESKKEDREALVDFSGNLLGEKGIDKGKDHSLIP